jgi:DNA-binding LacI/PurR family transcriptional regulator
MVHPTLTVIDLPAHEIGEAAAHILIDQINGEERFAPQQLLSGELILNESTTRL